MISTDVLQIGFLSSLTIDNERSSLTIVNEVVGIGWARWAVGWIGVFIGIYIQVFII